MNKKNVNEMTLENEEVISENNESQFENQQNNVGEATEQQQEQDPDFIPMQIGDADTRSISISDTAYFKVCETLGELKEALEKLLLKEGRFSIDEFFEFLQHEPERWIFDYFVKQNNINYPFMDDDRLFEQKLIKIKGIEDVLVLRKQFTAVLEGVKNSGFYYPLKKLYNPDENIFAINTDFCEQQEARFSRFTQTKEQNVILEVFNRLTDVLNELNDLNIIRAQHGPDEIKMIADWIDISKSNSRPFVVDNVLFYKHRLTKYRIKDYSFRNAVKFENIFL
jgi:hypothetical protein